MVCIITVYLYPFLFFINFMLAFLCYPKNIAVISVVFAYRRKFYGDIKSRRIIYTEP